ncbi:Hypothetical protein NTJ_00591 [Nesidiocoris tenuis]|uniref:Uncharacterized protein n=1 Tax=Nesidiocoris tenuis TaxID=355587 RepID=A0ABN7A6Q1_9HEMI|nr:Hypothetical protein NTJ_00591 [Nesidiocoris tenuis]
MRQSRREDWIVSRSVDPGRAGVIVGRTKLDGQEGPELRGLLRGQVENNNIERKPNRLNAVNLLKPRFSGTEISET